MSPSASVLSFDRMARWTNTLSMRALLVLLALLVASCAHVPPGPGPSAGSGEPVPRVSSAGDSVLVFHGWQLDVPEDWLFTAPVHSPARDTVLQLVIPDSWISGTVEVVALESEQTGVTETVFLQTFAAMTGQRAEAMEQRFFDERPHSLALFELTFSTTLVRIVVAVHQEEVMVIRLELPSVTASREDLQLLDVAADHLLAGLQPVGEAYDGRYLRNGASFSHLGSLWRFLADVPGGMTMVHHSGRLGALWRRQPDGHSLRAAEPSGAQMLDQGVVPLSLGPTVVMMDYELWHHPGPEGFPWRALVLWGSFEYHGERWTVMMREPEMLFADGVLPAAPEILGEPVWQQWRLQLLDLPGGASQGFPGWRVRL